MLTARPITENFPDEELLLAVDREAFPPQEYLSPKDLLSLTKMEGFDFLALYDEERFVGFMAIMTYKSLAYLFFLAIAQKERGRGYGSQALALLRSQYPDKQPVVDMEELDEKAPNCHQRIIRRQFYLRNGYKATGHYLRYKGVDYEVLSGDGKLDWAVFQELMYRIPLEGFTISFFTR